MRLIDKILLALDFADASDNLMLSAIELARIFDSPVVPVHVLPDDLDNQKVIDVLTSTAEDKLRKSVDFITSQGGIPG